MITHTALRLAVATVLVAVCAGPLHAGGSVVPVGTYLYARPDAAAVLPGSLKVGFSTSGARRLVVAWGRKVRKDRASRAGTTEAEREIYKPWLATLAEGGRLATFPRLPADYYDLVVVDPERMTVHEGLALQRDPDPLLASPELLAEIEKSLGLRTDRLGGWEAFFDQKAFIRVDTDGVRAGVLVQQMRLGKALAESGAVLTGCIHSLDVVWMERAKVDGAGWQVLARQQLYRDELPARTFFRSTLVPALCGLRVGTTAKDVGPIDLP